MKRNVLDLREPEVAEIELDFSCRRIVNWIFGIAAGLFIAAAILLFLHWLDAGCQIQGYLTLQGKVCIN